MVQLLIGRSAARVEGLLNDEDDGVRKSLQSALAKIADGEADSVPPFDSPMLG